jgi:hypothetical protein
LISFPLWYNAASGRGSYRPVLDVGTQEKQCVEPATYMRASHMRMLDEWRNAVVREGDRLYAASDGKEYNMSLTRTCLKCHAKKEKFCDQCHSYEAVTPNCWNCHVIPEETK